mgnify:CR=1 FL=1
MASRPHHGCQQLADDVKPEPRGTDGPSNLIRHRNGSRAEFATRRPLLLLAVQARPGASRRGLDPLMTDVHSARARSAGMCPACKHMQQHRAAAHLVFASRQLKEGWKPPPRHTCEPISRAFRVRSVARTLLSVLLRYSPASLAASRMGAIGLQHA